MYYSATKHKAAIAMPDEERRTMSTVISVSHFAENDEIKNAMLKSDYIRRASLNRLWAIPGVDLMERTARNGLYDQIKKQVENELK